MHRFIEIFAHMIWPQSCPVCGEVTAAFCQKCLTSVIDPLPLFCLECGGLFGVECCNASVPCFALTEHDGDAREFLLRLKYHNVRSLGLPMGRLIGEHMPRMDADLILPVPLHTDSFREYNQTELLSYGISDRISIPADKSILSWKRNSGRQTGRTGKERTAMPLDSMYADSAVRGKKVLLVDDVYTTGGTLRAAKHSVEAAGGTVSGALLWARRVSSSEPFESWNKAVDD